MPESPSPTPLFVRTAQLAERWGCSYDSASRFTRLPDFPAAFRPTARTVLFDLREVEAWERLHMSAPQRGEAA